MTDLWHDNKVRATMATSTLDLIVLHEHPLDAIATRSGSFEPQGSTSAASNIWKRMADGGCSATSTRTR